MDTTYVLFPSSLPRRSSTMSVVFDSNASLNDVAPMSPILSSVDLIRMEERVYCGWMYLCCLFCFHSTDRVQ